MSSCLDLIDGIDGNNNPTTEIRNVPAFKGVVSRGSFEVRIIQGTVNEVVINAESNLLQFIETRVSGNNLVIKTHNNRRLNNHKPMIITVTTTEIDKIELDGSGYISSDSIDSPELDLNLSGSGHIELDISVDDLYGSISGSGHIDLSGFATNGKLNISGSGKLDAHDLIMVNCMARISGSGKMYIFVNDFIDASISGSGSIYYDGNPSVTSHISGSGKVIHL
jgi:hypothetical protein